MRKLLLGVEVPGLCPIVLDWDEMSQHPLGKWEPGKKMPLTKQATRCKILECQYYSKCFRSMLADVPKKESNPWWRFW
jgi:hypothetical protein